MKRKILSLILLACIIVGVSGCTSAAQKDSLIGKWEINYDELGFSVDEAAIIINLELIDEINYNMSISSADADPVIIDGDYIEKNNELKLYVNDVDIDAKLTINDNGDLMWSKSPMKKVDSFTYLSTYFQSKTNQSELAESSTNQAEQQSVYTFTAGNYVIGVDIPVGTYDMVWVSGSGVCSAGKPGYRDIESFGEGSGDIKEFRNTKLENGGTVEVTGTLAINFVKK